jgi:protein-disulfide isomerase
MRCLAALALSLSLLSAQSKPVAKPVAKPAATTGKSAFDKAAFEPYVRHLFLYGPNVAVKISDPKPCEMPGFQEVRVTFSAGQVSQDEVFYVSKDGKKIVRGAIFDIDQNPFQEELNKLHTDLQPSIGTPGAPVVIVEFSDFECSYCREEAKMIRENLLKTFPKEVRLYYKDFPLDAIHPWARQAAIAGRCVFRQNPAAFWEYHDWIFGKQPDITPEKLKTEVMTWAEGKGLDMLQFGRCYDNKSTEPEVNKSVAEGQSLRIQSTPTLFVNGRKLEGSVPWPNLKAIIEGELDYQKTTGLAGEKCCEVKLPSPLVK